MTDGVESSILARMGRVTGVVVLLFLSGCAAKGSDSEDLGVQRSALTQQLPAVTQVVSLNLPPSVDATRVVLGASGDVVIGGGATVQPSAEFGGGDTTSLGSLGVTVQPDAKVRDLWGKSIVDLKDRVRVDGTVYSPNIKTGTDVTITGGRVTNAVFQPPSVLSFTAQFPAGQFSDVNLEPPASVRLLPGRFLKLRLAARAQLELTSGSYYTEELALEPDGKLVLDQAAGPITIYARNKVQFRATVTVKQGGTPDLLVVYLGTEEAFLDKRFVGTFVAPAAKLSLRSVTNGHEGAFFAKTLSVDGGATVKQRPALPLITVSVKDLEDCTRAMPVRMNLPAREREIAYQKDVTRYCTMPGESSCLTGLTGRANADYHASALATSSGHASPAQYLALSRDRRRKLNAAEDNPTLAASLCSLPDSDGDWVPDASDACPGTPDLTATNDAGCPLTTLPPAPSSTDVRNILDRMGVLVSPKCADAQVPPMITAGAFYYPSNPNLGSYILGSRIVNQPAGCPIWYQFEIEELELVTRVPKLHYSVVWLESEATAGLIGTSNPVLPNYIQFNPKPTETGARHQLATAGGRVRVRFRVRGVNANGARGSWSEWKITDRSDCLALGFDCTVRG